ncbi:hypothetical protein DEIPH_ctg011orf0206 [Deinococcus phoenicis]|uniref:DhaL domain-containing protein n=1 Tax=Deinococcus phoenicis TaxID=1476583 RepID=A0A016QT26_9DEIO|nr:dihydroxyacetone kinase subunit DhaL [Deinococcus phoenicis]EYB69213.1 hypothetical protein DEIPH_ctg011orf0206 [Deinococcus phoenicis]
MPVTADDLRHFLRVFQEKIQAQAPYLTELDAAIGDADHGSGIERGVNAVVAALPAQGDPSAVLKSAAMSFIGKVGGASGPLYGTAFLRASAALAGKPELGREDLRDALEAGYRGLIERGKAEAGDKTMLDAWRPALDALERGETLRQAAQAAAAGAEATTTLIARKGRASYLGERSLGHIDPGAASSALLWQSLAEALSGPLGEDT